MRTGMPAPRREAANCRCPRDCWQLGCATNARAIVGHEALSELR
jgi:hypothetical protein